MNKISQLVGLILMFGMSAAAQNINSPDFTKEEDWIPLENDMSRQELFSLTKPQFSAEAIPATFHFPSDTIVDTVNKVERKNSIFGIDISHYTKAGLPFDQLVAQNVQYVYAKATQGTTNKDAMFGKYWKAMDELPDKQKVFRGAYHFLSSSDDAKLQAERFVAYVNLQGGFKANDLPPCMDLEWDIATANGPDRWKNVKPADIVQRALTFLQRVEELTGKTPMIYTARSWWRGIGIPESQIAKFSKYTLWVADYSKSAHGTEVPASPNKAKPALWQFIDAAKLTNFAGGTDADIFYGTEEDFLATFLPKK
jgi:lysozyme